MSEMNETKGRASDHEPTPPPFDMVYCAWKNTRITVHEAQAIFTPNNIECEACMECQACQKKTSS